MIPIIIGGLICTVVGFIGGLSLSNHYYESSKVGKLRMDTSTGDLYLFLELSAPTEFVLHQKEVVLDVDLTPLRDNNMD